MYQSGTLVYRLEKGFIIELTEKKEGDCLHKEKKLDFEAHCSV